MDWGPPTTGRRNGTNDLAGKAGCAGVEPNLEFHNGRLSWRRLARNFGRRHRFRGPREARERDRREPREGAGGDANGDASDAESGAQGRDNAGGRPRRRTCGNFEGEPHWTSQTRSEGLGSGSPNSQRTTQARRPQGSSRPFARSGRHTEGSVCEFHTHPPRRQGPFRRLGTRRLISGPASWRLGQLGPITKVSRLRHVGPGERLVAKALHPPELGGVGGATA